MERILLLIVVGFNFLLMGWASEPLKTPLKFVHSDSIVVWGDDRSDFRMSALAVAPELQARQVVISQEDKRNYKSMIKIWKRDVLPALNILGTLENQQGDADVLSIANLVENAGKLFLQTADRQYVDVLERTALNGLMKVAIPGELSFEKHIAARALMLVSGMIYATDDEGLFVNLYINNSTHVKNGRWDFVIEQLTAMPHAGRVKLRISGLEKGLKPIKLRLRMPDWAYQGDFSKMGFAMRNSTEKLPAVYVNGREEFYSVEKGYLVISRKWNSGDEVFFDFPFDVKLFQPVKDQNLDNTQVAFQRGPLVYGFKTSVEGWVKPGLEIKECEEPNRYGHSVIEVATTSDGETDRVLKAEPVMDGMSCYWLKYDGK